jgi:aspartyl-tRNA(Asn)/glutamyl-tRNA(Gln) amidotransferase subunit A
MSKEFDIDLLLSDAFEQRLRLQSGALTSESLVRQTLAAIREMDPNINAYISFDAEAALMAARASDQRRQGQKILSPLDGLTLAVKDNIDVAGMVTTGGLNIPASAPVAERDAFVVKRLRDAGCVILGKLNMHEAALGACNDNPHHGKCFNPHRAGYTPGGSSGGSGAAVAAGLCTFALGTDTMGSVRIPAAYCGVSGIKPTAGAVSIDGTVLLSRRLDNIGPLARSARDLQWILPVMHGFDPSCAQSQKIDMPTGLDALENLSFGVARELQTVDVETNVIECFEASLALFRQQGAILVDRDLRDFDFGKSRRAGLLVCEVDMYIHHRQQLGDHPEYYSPELLKMMQWGIGKSAVDVTQADWRMDDTAVRVNQWLQDVDFLLLPTAPQVAFDFNESAPPGQADLTNIANMSGHPAISVPMGSNADGLPMGLQIIGPHGSDLQLIELAQWFSEARQEVIA